MTRPTLPLAFSTLLTLACSPVANPGDDSAESDTEGGGDDGSDGGSGDGTDGGAGDGSDGGSTDGSDGDDGSDGGTTADTDVCDDGTAPFSDLQAAIDAASDGDTISVCAGTWGAVVIDQKEVVVTGVDGAEATTIMGSGEPAVTVTNGAATLSGFTLTGEGREYEPTALLADAATVNLADVRVENNTLREGASSSAVQLEFSTVNFDNVRFVGNQVQLLIYQYRGSGIMRHLWVEGNSQQVDRNAGLLYFTESEIELSNSVVINNQAFGTTFTVNSPDAWIHNNVVAGNDSDGFSTVYLQGDSVDFQNNIVVGNGGRGVEPATASVAIEYNDIWGHDEYDIREDRGDTWPNNLSADPKFADAGSGDYRLLEGFSPCIDAGNPLSGYNDTDGTRNDMGAYGGPLGSW